MQHPKNLCPIDKIYNEPKNPLAGGLYTIRNDYSAFIVSTLLVVSRLCTIALHSTYKFSVISRFARNDGKLVSALQIRGNINPPL